MVRGKAHDYLGTTIEFWQEKKVKVTMYNFIRDMLKEVPDKMKETAVTPAANHMFKVNPSPKYLDTKKAELFHHLVAKCLFLYKQARPDIHPTV